MQTVQKFSGKRLGDHRNALKLTQHDLASKLRERGFGTTQTTISRWEAGQQPNGSVLPALAAELGVEISDLYGDDDDEESHAVDVQAFLAALAPLARLLDAARVNA